MALIALGVTGGIGAYKAVEVARGLQKRGHDVVAVMTRVGARGSSAPLTFEAITRRPVHHRPVDAGRERRHRAHRARVEHRPAAGRAGHGQRHRQVRQRHRRRLPVVAVPGDDGAGAAGAGDEHATCSSTRRCSENLETLAARGVRFVEPGEGYLACGWIGKGRLAEPDEIVAAAEQRARRRRGRARGHARARHRRADLRGHRSGALRRQPSSGRMGFALAAEARAPRRRGDAGRRADARSTPPRGVERRARAQRRRDARAP